MQHVAPVGRKTSKSPPDRTEYHTLGVVVLRNVYCQVDASESVL